MIISLLSLSNHILPVTNHLLLSTLIRNNRKLQLYVVVYYGSSVVANLFYGRLLGTLASPSWEFPGQNSPLGSDSLTRLSLSLFRLGRERERKEVKEDET